MKVSIDLLHAGIHFASIQETAMHRITNSFEPTLNIAAIGADVFGHAGLGGRSRHSRCSAGGLDLSRALPILGLLCLCGSAVASSPQEVDVSKSAPAAQSSPDMTTSKSAPVRFDAPAPRRSAVSTASEQRSKLANDRVQHTSRLDPTQMLYDVSADGAIWVHGNSYKARFDRNGATYFPFLGSKAPRNYPITLALSSVTVGTQTVALDAARVSREGDLVAIDRTGLIEQYVMKPESMEQEFVFERLPTGGDLVLRMDVASELSSAERTDGFEYSNLLGAVRYSRAVVIDAAGNRSTAQTSLLDGAIEIRVAATVLAKAAFPIVIDPVVTTFTVDASINDDINPDIAYDSTRDVYAVAWESAFSATDHDCYCQLQSASGATIAGSSIQIDFTSDFWARPKIANNANASQFLVVASVGSPGSRIIRGRGRDAGSNNAGAQFTISDPSIPQDQFNADVGGDPTFAPPSYYFVTWERARSATDHDIFARRVEAGFGVGPLVLVDNSTGTLDAIPSISKCDGNLPFATQRWTIVWQREDSPNSHVILGAQYSWDGTLVIGSHPIVSSIYDLTLPTVSSLLDAPTGERSYLITTQMQYPGDMNILCVVRTGATNDYLVDLESLEHPATVQNQVRPHVDSDGCDFAVVYSELFGTSATDYDVYITSLYMNPLAFGIIEAHQTLALTDGPETVPQVTSRHSGGAGGPRYGVVWQRNLFTDDIVGGIYDTPLITAYCSPGTANVIGCPCSNPATAGHGCDNSAGTGGALLTATGVASISGDTLEFTQSNELPNAMSIVLQGGQSNSLGNTFGDGVRCVDTPLKRLYTHAASGGVITAPVGADASVHTRSAALGDAITACQSRYYQIYYRDANLVFCSPGFNVGNGLKILWVP
jgi:hypothetical protein